MRFCNHCQQKKTRQDMVSKFQCRDCRRQRRLEYYHAHKNKERVRNVKPSKMDDKQYYFIGNGTDKMLNRFYLHANYLRIKLVNCQN